MRGLRARLGVLFVAVAAVGVTIAYVGFVVWGQRQVEVARRAEMRTAAETVLARLSAPRGELHRLLEEIADDTGIAIAVAGEGVPWLFVPGAGAPGPGGPGSGLPVDPATALGAPTLIRGRVHLAVPVPERLRPWTHVVASRPPNDVYDRVFGTQRSVFWALALAFVAMVAVGLLLARRSFLEPFDRLQAMVARSDHAALRELGGEADSFAALGRSIAGMNERIANDRERIASQLDQLRAAHDELAAAQDHLVRAERLAVVGTLAAGLAHEVGNPLAVVNGFVELLRDSGLSAEERTAAIDRIEHELGRIQAIVRDLLDFSRASSESEGSCSVGPVLADLEGLLTPQKRFSDVTLTVGCDGDLEVAIERGALLQVLVNLALNAADAMEGAGRCCIRAGADGDEVRVSVEDSGPGIAAEQRERIFEPFYTTKPAGLGTGLGLAVCERIVQAVGGTISVEESRELGGAAFTLHLRRVTPSARAS